MMYRSLKAIRGDKEGVNNMKKYEMIVKTYDDDKVIHEWSGSELFEAETLEEALHNAVASEVKEHRKEAGHQNVMGCVWEYLDDRFGTVRWSDGDDELCELIEMVERSE